MVRQSATLAASLVLAISFGAFQVASAQTVIESYSSPSSSYVCPQCGRVHSSSHAVGSAPVISSGTIMQASANQVISSPISSSPIVSSSPVQYSSPAPVANSYSPSSYSSGTYSSGGTSNVLAMLNGQRARQGIPSLNYDPTLQAVAQRRAQQMASMGLKHHPPGSFAPGRYEGVGWSSSFSPSGVSACYTSDPNMRYAGAAMATGRDGVYFAVVYR